MTRARDVADAQDNLGGAVAPFVAGKNKIINGDFSQWQRGTSFTLAGSIANNFTADRFNAQFDGTGATCTVTQQTFTTGAAPVAGYEGTYFARWNRSAAGSGNTLNYFKQQIEDVRTFAGQNITLSFWAKADATRTLIPQMYQEFGSGGSGAVLALGGSVSLTTTWQRFTITATVPSISGKTIGTNSSLTLYFIMPTGVAFTIDYWGIMVEAGSVATPFTPAGGGFPGAELALCQRYYQTDQSAGTGSTSTGYLMQGITSSRIVCNIFFPVQMRTTPTVTMSTGAPYWESVPYNTVGSLTLSAVEASKMTRSGGLLSIVGTFGTTPVQNYPGLLGSNQITYSAEL